MACIDVQHLNRSFTYYEKETGYKGSFQNLFHRKRKVREAVKDISFSIEQGEFVGFIGPNGAGKTTTLKMLSGILYPTLGTATVNGYIPWERKEPFKKQITLVAGQKSQLWPDLPAADSFYLNKCLYEIPDRQYQATLQELTELLGVGDKLNIQVRRLSLGERMKMELAAALLHNPQVIFLDEPTIGLDLLSQQSIRSYLKDYNKRTGATMILTSHYVKDIEELCSRAIVITNGKKVYDGPLESLKQYGEDGSSVEKGIEAIFHQEAECI